MCTIWQIFTTICFDIHFLLNDLKICVTLHSERREPVNRKSQISGTFVRVWVLYKSAKFVSLPSNFPFVCVCVNVSFFPPDSALKLRYYFCSRAFSQTSDVLKEESFISQHALRPPQAKHLINISRCCWGKLTASVIPIAYTKTSISNRVQRHFITWT